MSSPDPIKQQAVADSKARADDLVQSHEPFARAVAHLRAQTERPSGKSVKPLPWDPLENEPS